MAEKNEKKENELYNLIAPFVALVKRGANKKTFFLKKSEEEEMTGLEKISQMVRKAELPDEALQKINELKNKDGQDLEAEEIEALKASLKLMIALKQKIGEKIIGELSALSEIDGPNPKYGYPVSQGTGGNVKKDEKGNEVPENEKEFEIEIEKVKKALCEKEKEVEAYKAEIKKMKEKPVPEVPDAQKKSMPIKKSDGSYDFPENFTKEQIAELEPILKSNDELKARLEKEQNEKVFNEFVAKAKELKNISVKPEELATILKGINEKMSKEDQEKIFGILKGADEVVSKNAIFKEFGSGAEGEKLDAEKEIELKIVEISKSDSGKGQSYAQLYDRVMKEHPDLYEKYLNQKATR